MRTDEPIGGVEKAKAEWITRVASEAIDSVAWPVAFLPLVIGIGVGAGVGGAGFAVLALIGVVVTIAALVWVASKYQNGQSVGKRVMGTQVVSANDGTPLNWAFNLIVRTILVKGLAIGIVSSLTFYIFMLINFLWPLWDKNQQAVHDKMVNTYVIKLRSAYDPTLNRRFGAYIIDLIVVFIIALIMGTTGLGHDFLDLEAESELSLVLSSGIATFGYFFLLTAFFGATLGKMALGIKVTDSQGNRPGFSSVFIREFIGGGLAPIPAMAVGQDIGGLASLLIALAVVFFILIDDRRQGLHDKAAETFVIRAE